MNRTFNMIRTVMKDYFRDTTMLGYGAIMTPAVYLILEAVMKVKGYEQYNTFVFFGILLVATLSVGLFNLPIMLSGYIEGGLNKKLYTTPMRGTDYLAAIVLSQLLMILLSAVPIVIVGYAFGLEGNIASIGFIGYFLFNALILLMFGMVISAFFRTITSIKGVANLFYFYFMFLGDVFYRTEGMKPFFQKLALANPVHHMAVGLRSLSEGKGVDALGFVVPLCWLLVSVVLFGVRYKKVMQVE